jgi:riboflavin synthase
MVQGHVDGTGSVTGVKQDGDTVWLTISLPKELFALTVMKGSIAIDGVSLTVADKAKGEISIMLMAYTLNQTTFKTIAVGQKVNVETDMLARHVAELVKAFMPVTV